jgi:uncharacterized protein YjbI with pentapeptide repeats
MPQVCSHSFTPNYEDSKEEYEHKGSDEAGDERWRVDDETLGVEDGEWTCPHDAVAGKEKCIFHLPPGERPPGRSALDEFLTMVEEGSEAKDRDTRKRKLQFVDAEFKDFDISGEIIGGETNYHIDLSHATIQNADLTDTRFCQPLRLTGATFIGPAWFRQTTFEQHLGMRYATFEDDVRFRGTTFCSPVHFTNTRFECNAWFWYAVFHRFAIFLDSEFGGKAYFRGVSFDDYVRFSRARFNSEAIFVVATFDGEADFIETRFEGDHRFTGATFREKTSFTEVITAGTMDLSATSIADLRMTPERLKSRTQYVNLSGSTIENGELGQPKNGNILYDAEKAMLGTVEITHPDQGSVVDHVRLVQTTYDGFEFETDDMNPQSQSWRIHDVFNDQVLPPKKRGELSVRHLRETYLKAKNGAKETGNSTAVGNFYYKEMKYRRKDHMSSLISKDRGLSALFLWAKNVLLMLTTGYGERPARVIGSSLGIVAIFAVVLDHLSVKPLSITQSVLFSTQSFLKFIIGHVPRETTVLVAVVSVAEGFLGAFFIALFVYTFTRRLNR